MKQKNSKIGIEQQNTESVNDKKPRTVTGDYSHDNPPPYDVVSKRPEYKRFIQWLSQFSADREPKTQRMLAQDLGVNEVQLSQWKWMPELWRDVSKLVDESLAQYDADINHAYALRVRSKGMAEDIKTWYKMYRKTDLKTDGGVDTTALDAFAQMMAGIMAQSAAVDAPKGKKGKHRGSVKLGN